MQIRLEFEIGRFLCGRTTQPIALPLCSCARGNKFMRVASCTKLTTYIMAGRDFTFQVGDVTERIAPGKELVSAEQEPTYGLIIWLILDKMVSWRALIGVCLYV